MGTQFNDGNTPVAKWTWQGEQNGKELWVFAPLSHWSPNDPAEWALLQGEDGTEKTLLELVEEANREGLAVKFLPVRWAKGQFLPVRRV